MAEAWLSHVVRSGEGVSLLAFLRGTTVEEVWNHPKNAELKSTRDNPDVLEPGDLIWLPRLPDNKGKTLTPGAQNAFQADVPEESIVILLRDHEDAPLEGFAYRVLDIDGRLNDQSGTSGGGGKITIIVPVLARMVRILLSELDIVMPFAVGGLAPLTTTTGALSRLKNLGYYSAAPSRSTEAEKLRRGVAITQFQRDYGFRETGSVDEAVIKKLGELVGPDKGFG